MPRRNRPSRPQRPRRMRLPYSHGAYYLPESTEQTGSENNTNTKENQR